MVQIKRTIVVDVILAVPIAIAGGAGLSFCFHAAYLWEEHVKHDAQVPIPPDGRIHPLGIGLLLLSGALSLTYLLKRSRAKKSSSAPAM